MLIIYMGVTGELAYRGLFDKHTDIASILMRMDDMTKTRGRYQIQTPFRPFGVSLFISPNDRFVSIGVSITMFRTNILTRDVFSRDALQAIADFCNNNIPSVLKK